MPEFESGLPGVACGKELADPELVRALRFVVAAEYEAANMYIQLAESVLNSLARSVFKDIADEELVHAGEFLRLLDELAPSEQELYAQGAHEVEEQIEKSRQEIPEVSPVPGA